MAITLSKDEAKLVKGLGAPARVPTEGELTDAKTLHDFLLSLVKILDGMQIRINQHEAQLGVGQQQLDMVTGYVAMTGTPDKGSTFAVSTVTLPQLAARVKSLQDTLTIPKFPHS